MLLMGFVRILGAGRAIAEENDGNQETTPAQP